MKNLFYALFIISTLLYISCNSCEGSDESFRGSGAKSKSKELIEKNIDNLGQARWDKKQYIEIRDNQIFAFKGTQNAKTALRNKLDYVYGKVLVNEGNLLMTENCSSSHKQLTLVMAELKNFPQAENAGELEKRYKEHQEMLSFINSMYSKQNVKSFFDSYDRSFETAIKNKADNYLNKEIYCTTVKKGLNNTASAFAGRRKDFANKVIDLYCQQTTFNRRDYNMLTAKLDNLSLRDNSWKDKLKEFKDKYSNE